MVWVTRLQYTVPKIPEMKLRDLVPNLFFYNHVYVNYSYFPTIGPPILLNCVCGPIVGIYI